MPSSACRSRFAGGVPPDRESADSASTRRPPRAKKRLESSFTQDWSVAPSIPSFGYTRRGTFNCLRFFLELSPCRVAG